jgi:hypothetical protein
LKLVLYQLHKISSRPICEVHVRDSEFAWLAERRYLFPNLYNAIFANPPYVFQFNAGKLIEDEIVDLVKRYETLVSEGWRDILWGLEHLKALGKKGHGHPPLFWGIDASGIGRLAKWPTYKAVVVDHTGWLHDWQMTESMLQQRADHRKSRPIGLEPSIWSQYRKKTQAWDRAYKAKRKARQG